MSDCDSDVKRGSIGILVGGTLAVDCELEDLKRRVRKVRVLFDEAPPDSLPLTGIIRQQRRQRELVLTLANYDAAKQRVIDAYKPIECVEVPMSLEDIFIECTRIDHNGSETQPSEPTPALAAGETGGQA